MPSFIKLTNTNAPSPRSGHTCILYQQYCYIFGGTNNHTNFNDTFEYHFPTKTFKKIKTFDTISGRYEHTSCLYGNCMIVFGGRAKTQALPFQKPIFVFDENIYSLNLESFYWDKLYVEGNLMPLSGHSANVYKDCMYIFGGIALIGQNLMRSNHLFKFDFLSNKCEIIDTLGEVPPKLANHTSAIYGDKMIIFGNYLFISNFLL